MTGVLSFSNPFLAFLSPPSKNQVRTMTSSHLAVDRPSVALIVGVTGMVGLSLAKALKNPTSPEYSPWTVYGVSRRPPPEWLLRPSETTIDHYLQFDALDAEAATSSLSPLSGTITHVFYVAVISRRLDPAGEFAGNAAMLANILRPLTTAASSSLRHVSLQTGTKEYIYYYLTGSSALPELPFKEDTPRLSYPLLYYHAQEDLLKSFSGGVGSGGFTWSVHRPTVILGASPRSSYNLLLSFAIYAAICRHEGEPFVFPGGVYAWTHLFDASDAELIADQLIWAATADAPAKNQIFNCSNGDVFSWRGFWRQLSEVFCLEFVDDVGDEETRKGWVEKMEGKQKVWEEIARENGLRETKLADVASFWMAYLVVNFDFQSVSSMSKSRELGFKGSVDTLKSISKWVNSLRGMKILP